MAERGLVARRTRAGRGTIRPDRSAGKAADVLGRDFTPPAGPDTRWCGDLTEIPTGEGKFYLATVLDLHSRRCVGFTMGPTTTLSWPARRCAWRSRCAAGRSPV